MTRPSRAVLFALFAAFTVAGTARAALIEFETNVGSFTVETYDDTPVAVNNFINYVEQDLLVDSFVHLAGEIPLVGGGTGSILWGGQYTIDVEQGLIGQVQTLEPVSEPAQATHSNLKYTITMAQTSGKEYTSGWFINMSDNTQLDGEQFTAWGEVIAGRDVVDAILAMPLADLTQDLGQAFSRVPFNNVNEDNTVGVNELIRLTDVTVTPEPASVALLGLGGVLLMRRRR